MNHAHVAGLSVLFAINVGCGSSDPSGVTYHEDIRPLFKDCTYCHQPGAPFGPGLGPDVLNPYSEPNGLVVRASDWKNNHPTYRIPDQLVTPGQPDESFLMLKISNPELGLLQNAGAYMPFQIPRITKEELLAIEQWVRDGAQNNDFFRNQVYPIFVSPYPYAPGKCDVCHADTPTSPNITDPFGPDGIVGVPSILRPDLLRIAPGDPDASLLVQQIRQSAGPAVSDGAASDNLPTREYGAPMPKPTAPLDDAQQAVVRQWILDGARP